MALTTSLTYGARMSNAFDFAFTEIGGANIVMIGTDSPAFPPEYIEDAFTALEKSADAVLGEAADGGFGERDHTAPKFLFLRMI